MNNTKFRRTVLITLLILIVPVTLLTLFAEPATGQAALSAHQNEIGNDEAHSPSCAPSLSPRFDIGIGELHGQIRYGRRSDAAGSKEPFPLCASDSPFAIRIAWIVGRSTIWSIEL